MGLSQASYIDKVLTRFSMDNSKKGLLPFKHSLVFSKEQCPKIQEEMSRMEGIPCWELTSGVSAQRKEQVPFKIFYTKRIYFSFELQTINTKLKLLRISNITLRSIGSNRELLTEKEI